MFRFHSHPAERHPGSDHHPFLQPPGVRLIWPPSTFFRDGETAASAPQGTLSEN